MKHKSGGMLLCPFVILSIVKCDHDGGDLKGIMMMMVLMMVVMMVVIIIMIMTINATMMMVVVFMMTGMMTTMIVMMMVVIDYDWGSNDDTQCDDDNDLCDNDSVGHVNDSNDDTYDDMQPYDNNTYNKTSYFVNRGKRHGTVVELLKGSGTHPSLLVQWRPLSALKHHSSSASISSRSGLSVKFDKLNDDGIHRSASVASRGSARTEQLIMSRFPGSDPQGVRALAREFKIQVMAMGCFP